MPQDKDLSLERRALTVRLQPELFGSVGIIGAFDGIASLSEMGSVLLAEAVKVRIDNDPDLAIAIQAFLDKTE